MAGLVGGVCGFGGNSRPDAEAVGGAGHHHLTERRHHDEDEDGHQLHEKRQTALCRRGGNLHHRCADAYITAQTLTSLRKPTTQTHHCAKPLRKCLHYCAKPLRSLRKQITLAFQKAQTPMHKRVCERLCWPGWLG